MMGYEELKERHARHDILDRLISLGTSGLNPYLKKAKAVGCYHCRIIRPAEGTYRILADNLVVCATCTRDCLVTDNNGVDGVDLEPLTMDLLDEIRERHLKRFGLPF